MRKTLITFGDENFAETRERFRKEAVASGWFDEVIAYGPADLDADFVARHGPFIKKNPRGHGYWIWKPHLIERTLEKMKDGEFLIYADAGCSINLKGARRLHEYLERARRHASGIMAFELPGFLERVYTKMDVFEALNAKRFMDASMNMATVIIICRREASMNFIREWRRWCEDYALISDEPSRARNAPGFKDHRHDQSIFSLLCKMRGVDSISDETYGEGAKSPILVTRIRPKLGFTTKLKRSVLKRRAVIVSRLGLRR